MQSDFKLKSIIKLSSLILLLLTLLNCQRNTPLNQEHLNLFETDSLIQLKNPYQLEYANFNKYMDSLKKESSVAEDSISVKYYFLQKKYAYNLNHSLEEGLPEIRIYDQYNEKTYNFEDSYLLKNPYYKNFIKTYLDLKAKYLIAEKKSEYKNNIFFRTQWDIATTEFSGRIKEYALYHLLKFQINVMGHEFDTLKIHSFRKYCKKENYVHEIDSLYKHLIGLKSETKEYYYKIDREDTLSAYVYFPKSKEKNRPCNLILHGGGWYIGHPLTRTHIPKQFNQLGFVSIALEHSIKGRQNATPVEGLQDARDAIIWARKNAQKLGIDPRQIIISGLSSGATLAALTAMADFPDNHSADTKNSSKPNAVIMWSGCVDVTVNNWFNYCLQNAAPLKTLSPIHLIKKTEIPFLIFQGDEDEYNDFETHIEFQKKMKAKNNQCKLILYENCGHTEVYKKDMMQEYRDFLHFMDLKEH
jgi:acetyl esterase/lipase